MMASRDSGPPPPASLWTTAAPLRHEPLSQSKIDETVSAEKLLEAIDAARKLADSSSGRLTERLLRKSF